jgi:hypothetical protein
MPDWLVTPDPYELLTRHDVAGMLRCSLRYVSVLTNSGQLHCIRVGRRIMVPRVVLEAFIRGESLDGANGWPPTLPLFDNEGNPTT